MKQDRTSSSAIRSAETGSARGSAAESVASSSAWYSTWFDTPLYEKLYAERDQQEAVEMIHLLERHLPIRDHARVLDLGCGRGRHSLEMAKRGYSVTGLDLSEQALQKARIKADVMGLSVKFIQGDMRNHIFEGESQESFYSSQDGFDSKEERRFDIIVNLFTTFGYFEKSEDDQLVLDAVSEMLKDGGWFVLDFLNPVWVRKMLTAEETRSLDGLTVHIKRWIEEDVSNSKKDVSDSEQDVDQDSFAKVHKAMSFSDSEGNSVGEFQESVRLYSLEWFEKQMQKRGFQLERLFGDYQGGNYQTGDLGDLETASPRMIQFYQKKL